MKALDPVELSALLDGELDPGRAAEIEALIAGDDEIRVRYEALKRSDAQLRSLAEAAAFQPRVTLPNRSAPAAWRPLLLLLFPCAWLAGKLIGAMPISLAINGVSLLVLIVCVALLASGDNGADRFHSVQTH